MTEDFQAKAREALATAKRKDNNSGGGANIVVPDSIKKPFNWGAFYFAWIWGICNKSYLTLISLAAVLFSIIPFFGGIVALGLQIWFGIKGNEWAWQNKEWQSEEHFHEVQKKWAIATIICSVLSIIFVIIYALIIVVMLTKTTY